MSRETRIQKVRDAQTALRTAVKKATEIETSGASESEIHAAWAEVETLGAVVHRQSRLLAGKPRGG